MSHYSIGELQSERDSVKAKVVVHVALSLVLVGLVVLALCSIKTFGS